jgi:hypothetical protein
MFAGWSASCREHRIANRLPNFPRCRFVDASAGFVVVGVCRPVQATDGRNSRRRSKGLPALTLPNAHGTVINALSDETEIDLGR